MAFASGKTVYFTGLLSVVDFIKAHPDFVNRALDTGDFSAIPDPEFKDKLDWLFAHFDHQIDQDEWATTLPAPPSSNAYKHLLLSHPEWLKTALQKIMAADVTIAPSDIKLSAPHEAYLRLHAARLGLDDSQTQALIDQQKQAAAAKAIDDLATQGVTTPDKTQIQRKLQDQIEWVNSHTASLQREVLRHDTRITDQLNQSFHRVINSQPTTIPSSEITAASRELANLSYQTLKPYISKVNSAADLVNVLKSDILTPDRISRIPTLAAYKIPPDLFHQALEAAAQNLYHHYIKPAQPVIGNEEFYGEADFHHVSSTTPPPQIPTHTDARDMFLAQGYPGEAIINASNPHALENYLAHTPKALLDIITAPVRLVFGEVETSFISLYLTRNRATVQAWALNRVLPLLPQELLDSRDPAQIQTWIRSQVQALHEGRLKVNFDTREKLLEANNNLNVLEFSEKYRALLEKIPGVKQLLNLWSNSVGRFNPIYANYLKAWLGLAFRSDPLTAGYLLVEYGAIRPAIAGLWKSAVVPLTRHLPFGWDVKQGLFGKEVYWKPAKWAKDNIKQGLGWLAEKTGVRKAGEWVAQKIFKTTFAKLAAAFSGLATGFLIAWGALKKSIKATAGLLFLFLVTHGLPTTLAALIGGGITAWLAAGLATTGAVLLGITSLPVLAVIAVVTFAIALPLAALFWGFMYLKSIGALSALGSWFTASLIPGISQFFASLGTITFPALAPWLVPAITGGLVFYQIYQTNLRNTALMAPALGPTTIEESAFIKLTKTVRQLQPFSTSSSSQITATNSQLPFTTEYTLTITPQQLPLQDLIITDTQTITTPSGTSTTTIPIPSPPLPLTESWSYSYTLSLTHPQHQDSLIANTVTVTANTATGPAGSSLATAAIIIGSPPVSCPTGWPTTSGYLTQGSRTTDTHAGAEAIDIGVSTGTPIFATSNGVISNIGTYALNCPITGGITTCPALYGNYVDVLTTCTGKAVTIRYAHLQSFASSIALGAPISFGQPIGTADNTGYSSGPHLHYHFLRSTLPMGSPFIPTPRNDILGCIGQSDCNTSW